MTFDERQAAFDLALNMLYAKYGIRIVIADFDAKIMTDANGRRIRQIEEGLMYEALPGWVESAPVEEKAPLPTMDAAPVKLVDRKPTEKT